MDSRFHNMVLVIDSIHNNYNNINAGDFKMSGKDSLNENLHLLQVSTVPQIRNHLGWIRDVKDGKYDK